MDAQLSCLKQMLAKLDIIIANQQGGEAEVIATLTCTRNDDEENGTLTFTVQFEDDSWTFTNVVGYSGNSTYSTMAGVYEDGVLTITERAPLWTCSSWSLTFTNTSTSNTAILYFDLHCAVGTTYTVMTVQK